MKAFEEISKLIEDHRYASDELYHFCLHKTWADAPKLEYKLSRRLAPHTDFYLSSLRPLFLFQSDTLNELRSFTLVKARDGVCSLLSFFLKNPEPKDLRTKLLIHEHFRRLIPKSWENHVALYNYSYDPKPLRPSIEQNQIIISILSHPKQFSLDYLEQKLLKIKETFKAPYHVLLSENMAFITDQDNEKESAFQFKVQQCIHRILGDQAKFIGWEKIRSLELQQCSFIDIDQYHFHYIDSFVHYDLISQGATPFDMPLIEKTSEYGDETITISTSPFEKVHIKPFVYSTDSLSGELDYLKQNILKEEVEKIKIENFKIQDQIDFEEVAMQHLRFCSPEFESFSFDLSRRLAKERND